jgi:hypothetical protein
MISRKPLIQAAAAELADYLRAQAFELPKARSEFLRRGDGKEDRLTVDVFKWSAADSWNLTFRLGVRFDAVEELRNSPCI